jgi:hypothetical protein
MELGMGLKLDLSQNVPFLGDLDFFLNHFKNMSAFRSACITFGTEESLDSQRENIYLYRSLSEKG